MDVLSPRQSELLAFIRAWPDPCPPTYRQMGRALGYAESNLTSHVSVMLAALERKGFIRRLYHKQQSLELLPEPVFVRGQPYRFIPKTRAA